MALSAAFLASCASPQPKAMLHKKSRSKEYFAESEYGVKASPRVTNKRSRLARGGGRDQIGKPYQVRGKWYYPKEDKNYRKVGAASWYGDAFHGRLTANGEIYDMTHLTAAHPTMPLPSYARVTNTVNGSSVIVRVNDRGPYSDGRIIDLSKRAAEMLDYAHAGTAKVKVEYVGRAPLDGHDEQYLMASYRPGDRAPDPSDGLPQGVMIAMNGPTPSAGVGDVVQAFPGQLNDVAAAEPVAFGASEPIVGPAFGPIIAERPVMDVEVPFQVASATMSYASDRVSRANAAFAALQSKPMSADDIVASWKRQSGGAAPDRNAYVMLGSFGSLKDAQRLEKALAPDGRIEVETVQQGDQSWYSVSLYATGNATLDALLRSAWDHGAPDAFIVRD